MLVVLQVNQRTMKNNLLSENLVYTGTSQLSTNLSLCCYNADEVKKAKGTTFKEVKSLLSETHINWLQVKGLKDTESIREVCEHFKINFLVLQDILNAKHPTKIEEHNNYTVLILKLFNFNEEDREDELQQQQLCIIHGSNYILTFLENDAPFFDHIFSAIHNDVLHIRNRQADYLLSVLLNQVMSSYIHIVTVIDDALEDLEEELLDFSGRAKNVGVRIQSVRRQYLQIKKAVIPLKEQYAKLFRSENQLMHKNNRAFFNDVNDHLQYVLQTIDICRESLSSLVDLYISNNDLRRNEIMKRLTVVSTIFIPLTFLVGVWGMNFSFMPELNWQHGYLFAWVLMIGIGLSVFLYFKTEKWN